MKFTETPLLGSYLIDLEPNVDDRGFFARLYCEKEYYSKGLNTKWLQFNTSLSVQTGTLRGLHFQRPPSAEVKVVRCISGAIWDVIVDLRSGSATLGRWFGAELTNQNRTMIYIPRGFAHGYISLEPNSEIFYMVSDFYSPQNEGSLLWNDRDVDIAWPIKPSQISDKDAFAMNFSAISPIMSKDLMNKNSNL
jgi:dTDP-4-dehydrorhamnose 3,5-epimerase